MFQSYEWIQLMNVLPEWNTFLNWGLTVVLTNCSTRNCNNLHSHQNYIRVSYFAHPYHHQAFWMWLIFDCEIVSCFSFHLLDIQLIEYASVNVKSKLGQQRNSLIQVFKEKLYFSFVTIVSPAVRVVRWMCSSF